MLLFVFPQSPIFLLDRGAAPTATETVQVAVATETMEVQETVVVVAPTEAATEEPTATVTVTPTATEALEAVGGSGLIVFASDRGKVIPSRFGRWKSCATRRAMSSPVADPADI